MLQGEEVKQEKMRSGFSNFKVELWKYQGESGALIPLLQSAQETYGYIPESVIDFISQIVGIPAAESTASSPFTPSSASSPRGRILSRSVTVRRAT